MEALRALYVVIELRDKLSSQLSEINKVVDQTKSKLSSLTEFVEKHKAAIAGLGAVLSAVGYGGFRIFGGSAKDFERAILEMQAKTAMTNKQLKEMTETVKDLARVNSDSFKTITDVVTILTERYGYLGKETKTAAQAVLDFAKITGSDAVSAANALSVVMRAFNIPATKMYQVTDTLIAAQQRFGVQSAELIELLKNNAAPLKMLNLSFSEAVGLLAALESNGVNVARVLMGLRSAAAKGIDIKKALRELAEIRDATERTRRATEIFGSYAGPGLARVLEGGTQALDEFMLKMEDVEGTTKRASATIDRSLSEQIGILKNNLTILAVEIGGSLLPVMKGMVKVIKSIADSFESLPAPIKGAIGVMAGFTTIAASVVGPLMLQAAAFAYFIKTIREFGGLQGLFMTLSGSITEFAASAFSALAPLLPIILAISAAILVLQHAWIHNWFGIRDATAKAIEGIKSAFSVISSAIKTFISGFIEPIKILFAPLLETLGLFNKEAKKSSLLVQVVDAITGAFKWLYSVLKPHIPLIKQIIKIVGTLAAVLFLATNPIGQAILAITGLAWVFNKLRSVAGPVINRLRQGFDWLAKSIGGAIHWIQQAIDRMGPLKYLLLGPVGPIVYLISHIDKLESATSSALSAIKSAWDATIGFIIAKINEFIAKVKQVWDFIAKSPIGKIAEFAFSLTPIGAGINFAKTITHVVKPGITHELTRMTSTPIPITVTHPAAQPISTYHIRHEHKTINVPKIEIHIRNGDKETIKRALKELFEQDFASHGIY